VSRGFLRENYEYSDLQVRCHLYIIPFMIENPNKKPGANDWLAKHHSGELKAPEGEGIVSIDIETGEATLIKPGSKEAEQFAESLRKQPSEFD